MANKSSQCSRHLCNDTRRKLLLFDIGNNCAEDKQSSRAVFATFSCLPRVRERQRRCGGDDDSGESPEGIPASFLVQSRIRPSPDCSHHHHPPPPPPPPPCLLQRAPIGLSRHASPFGESFSAAVCALCEVHPWPWPSMTTE